MLQFIFRTTLLVSVIGALFAVEFNSFHKAINVQPVQVISLQAPSSAASSLTPIEIAAVKKSPRADLSREQREQAL